MTDYNLKKQTERAFDGAFRFTLPFFYLILVLYCVNFLVVII